MAHRISEIKSLDPNTRAIMETAGIRTVEQLLAETANAGQRGALARQLGVSSNQLTEWINRADLMRLSGVGTEYANLLEDCGVDSCKELQHRVPANLHAKLKQVNDEQHITHHLPSLNQVETWVEEAKTIVANAQAAV